MNNKSRKILYKCISKHLYRCLWSRATSAKSATNSVRSFRRWPGHSRRSAISPDSRSSTCSQRTRAGTLGVSELAARLEDLAARGIAALKDAEDRGAGRFPPGRILHLLHRQPRTDGGVPGTFRADVRDRDGELQPGDCSGGQPATGPSGPA